MGVPKSFPFPADGLPELCDSGTDDEDTKEVLRELSDRRWTLHRQRERRRAQKPQIVEEFVTEFWKDWAGIILRVHAKKIAFEENIAPLRMLTPEDRPVLVVPREEKSKPKSRALLWAWTRRRL